MMGNGKRKPRRQLTPEEKWEVFLEVTSQAVEVELLREENDRLSEALKEMAIELTLYRGRQRSGFSARVPARVSAETKLELLGLIDRAVADGWAHVRACGVLDLADVRAHRWRQRLRDTGTLEDKEPGGGAVHRLLSGRRPRSWI